MIKIAVDAMGGDFGLSITIPASLDALQKFSDIQIYLVGKTELINSELAKYKSYQKLKNRVHITHANEVVAMDDKPSVALRRKKNSSMRLAIDLVKTKEVDACVSSGNTGALVAISYIVLRTISGIERPAIMTKLPTIKGATHMLDLGANVDSSAHNLLEFAVMADVYVRETEDKIPTIGLLNIGEEEVKGNEVIKQSAELIKQTNLDYYGFVEGDDIYKGTTDVVVCDGFEGNIALKSSEGLAKMVSFFLKQAFNKNIFTKIVALLSLPVLNSFKQKVNPDKYNGATLLGLNGIVIKSHGGAKKYAFSQAIAEARLEAKAGIITKISKKFNDE
jgi:glycerol-3-phosphate acyltransferase PlsX